MLHAPDELGRVELEELSGEPQVRGVVLCAKKLSMCGLVFLAEADETAVKATCGQLLGRVLLRWLVRCRLRLLSLLLDYFLDFFSGIHSGTGPGPKDDSCGGFGTEQGHRSCSCHVGVFVLLLRDWPSAGLAAAYKWVIHSKTM